MLCLTLVSGLLLLPATSASAASFVVTDPGDAGPGTFRQAILDANANPGADLISFSNGFGGMTITPLTPLPAITEQVTVDALTQPGSVDCASWPPTLMVRLEGSSAGPGAAGLSVTDGVGTTISGLVIRRFEGDGVSVSGVASGTGITCNAIGTNAVGTAVQGNGGAGIAIASTGSSASTISDNIVMNNMGAGVLVGSAARQVAIRGNRLSANGGLGIDLVATGGSPGGDGVTPNGASGPGLGGNDLQHMPDLTDASTDAAGTSVTGSLTVPTGPTPAGAFVVEFFTSPSCDDMPSPGGFGEGAAPIGSISVPAVDQSSPGTFAFTANGLDATNDGDAITATATDASGAGNTSEFSGCVPVVASSGGNSADLSVWGSVAPDPVAGNGSITYSLTVHNDGPDPATDVTFTNDLPLGVNLASATASAGSCAGVMQTVSCNLGIVDPGDANDVTVTIVGTVNDVNGVLIMTDQASVSSPTDDPDPFDNSTGIGSTARPRRVDLSVTKDGPGSVTEGDVFSYVIGVSNSGPDQALGVVLTDNLPSGLTYLGATPSAGTCAQSAGVLTCDMGALDAGASASVDLQVQADPLASPEPLTVENTASATSDRTDQNPDDDTSPAVSTTVMPAAAPPGDEVDLALTAVANTPNPVTGGYDVGYTATVTNLGPDTVSGAVLTDALALGETFVATGSDPSCGATLGVVSCALGDLASGDEASVLIVTQTPKVDVETTIHDGFAVAATGDGMPGNDSLDVATTVLPRRPDFAAGYVPASAATTWITDATQWVRGKPVATKADPTVALVGLPGGGSGGPVTITERPCGGAFACMRVGVNGVSYPAPKGIFGSLVSITIPPGYGPSNPVTAVFLDNWSVVGWGRDPLKVSYVDDTTGSFTDRLSWCGGWKHTGPPCVSLMSRLFSWWNAYVNGDLLTVARFTKDSTFGRGR